MATVTTQLRYQCLVYGLHWNPTTRCKLAPNYQECMTVCTVFLKMYIIVGLTTLQVSQLLTRLRVRWNRESKKLAPPNLPASSTIDFQFSFTQITSSRGKIMLTASTPRLVEGCTFCAYSEGPGLTRSCPSLPLCSSLHFGTCMCGLVNLPHWGTVGKAWIHSKVGYVHCCPRSVIQASASKLWLAHAEGEEREAGLRTFSIKVVRNPDHKLRHLLPHERTIKYGLQRAKRYQIPKFNTARTRRPLFPLGLPTGYEP